MFGRESRSRSAGERLGKQVPSASRPAAYLRRLAKPRCKEVHRTPSSYDTPYILTGPLLSKTQGSILSCFCISLALLVRPTLKVRGLSERMTSWTICTSEREVNAKKMQVSHMVSITCRGQDGEKDSLQDTREHGRSIREDAHAAKQEISR